MKTENQRFRDICKAKTSGLVSTVIELCEAYLKDFPQSNPVGVWNFYADALSDSSSYKKARYWYSKTINELEKLNSKTVRHAYCGLGKMFERKGNYKNAIIWFKKATDIDSEDATYLIFTGVCYYRLGKINEAQELLRKATLCKEGCIDEAFYNLGVILGSQRNYQEALICFEKALSIDPKYTLANLGIKDMNQILNTLKN